MWNFSANIIHKEQNNSDMKKTKYTIQITSPCNESWNEMTTNSLGKYCDNCAKNVIDFQDFSDDEMVRFLNKSKSPVCGRIANHRLNKEIEINDSRKNYRFSILVASLVLVASNGVFSQIYVDKVITEQSTVEQVVDTSKQDTIPSKRVSNILRGKVIDAEFKENLAFVNVYYKDRKLGINTDFDGKFSLVFDDYQLLPDSFEVVMSYVGYENKSIWIQKDKFPVNEEVLVALKEGGNCFQTLGELIITRKKPQN